jgi:hypothetical protein
MAQAPPTRTADFISTIGVDGHLSTGAAHYGDIPTVISQMQYLGITAERDGDNGNFDNLVKVAQEGIKFDFLFAGGGSMNKADLQREFTVVNQLAAAVPGSVFAVEGANEINNFPITYNGVSGTQGAVNLQTDLYSLAKADASLPGVNVYYFTGFGESGNAMGPNPATTPGLADYDNQHPYPQNGTPPLSWVQPAGDFKNESVPGPGVYTEGGYSSTGTFGGNLGVGGQAKYTLDMLMDDAKLGIHRTYLYELQEEGDGLGLFDTSNQAKPVATAIHNLTTILKDSGATAATFTAAPASYTTTGQQNPLFNLALAKSDGTTDIVVWGESAIGGAASNVTVSLDKTYQTVRVFDPLLGTTATQTLSNVSSVTLAVSDHPLIVEVGSGGTIPTPPPPPTPVPPPTPPPTTDTLTLRMAEDAWQGDAQFTVSVDGKQVGGTLTASALHATPDSNVFTLTGNWGVGQHAVQIQFLNDAYGGTSTTDRNLYTNSIAYDGTTYSGTSASMLSAGAHAFTVGGTTPAVAAPSDVLTLHLSEDAWKGDAQFTLAIDGKQITTAQNVTALHSAGSWQDLSFAGNFGAGSHQIGITFTNDSYGGTPTTDRNLYVNGIEVNGQHYGGGVTPLLSNGTASFTVSTTH